MGTRVSHCRRRCAATTAIGPRNMSRTRYRGPGRATSRSLLDLVKIVNMIKQSAKRTTRAALPCGELVTEVTDESGSQELHVTDSLQKLRMDRHGVPIDLPERVEWGHVIAPAFQQRKVVRLMEEAQQYEDEVFSHLAFDESDGDENDWEILSKEDAAKYDPKNPYSVALVRV